MAAKKGKGSRSAKKSASTSGKRKSPSRKRKSPSSPSITPRRKPTVSPRATTSPRPYTFERRRAAALKSWETRRRNEREHKRTRLDLRPGPGSRLAGWTVYDELRGISSEFDLQTQAEKWLEPYYGRVVKVTMYGKAREPKTGEPSRIFRSRSFRLDDYDDAFGSSGAFGSMMRAETDDSSDFELGVNSLTIEFDDPDYFYDDDDRAADYPDDKRRRLFRDDDDDDDDGDDD